MQKATVILAIIGVALVTTALIGITYAQFATPNPTATPANPTATPWCINGYPNVSAPYCYNSTNSAPPYCYNGTYAGSPYGYNGEGYNAGYSFGCHCYGAQGGSQYQYGDGMMGRWGMNGRWW